MHLSACTFLKVAFYPGVLDKFTASVRSFAVVVTTQPIFFDDRGVSFPLDEVSQRIYQKIEEKNSVRSALAFDLGRCNVQMKAQRLVYLQLVVEK